MLPAYERGLAFNGNFSVQNISKKLLQLHAKLRWKVFLMAQLYWVKALVYMQRYLMAIFLPKIYQRNVTTVHEAAIEGLSMTELNWLNALEHMARYLTAILLPKIYQRNVAAAHEAATEGFSMAQLYWAKALLYMQRYLDLPGIGSLKCSLNHRVNPLRDP